MLNLLRRRPRDEDGHLARLKALARAELALGQDDGVSVSEIDCADPACPGVETVVLVLRAGARTRAAKVAKPAAQVTAADLAEALAPLREG